jgi:hypothetical protein
MNWHVFSVGITKPLYVQNLSEDCMAVVYQRKRPFVYQCQRACYRHCRGAAEWRNGLQSGGQIQIVRLFGLIGGFVLLLACINFMNLSTARSGKRVKEVGVRKTMGSNRGSVGQAIPG